MTPRIQFWNHTSPDRILLTEILLNQLHIMATQADLLTKIQETDGKVDAAASRVLAAIAAAGGDTQPAIDALTATDAKIDAIAPAAPPAA